MEIIRTRGCLRRRMACFFDELFCSMYLCYSCFMAIDITQIQLTDADRQLLASVAERTGKPWQDVLQRALHAYTESVPQPEAEEETESWYDRLLHHGQIGSVPGGPADLSTNPVHMEGFGESDH